MAEIDLATRTLQLAIKSDTENLLSKMDEIVDPTGSPGPQTIKAGDLHLGYFGFTTSAELISGNSLASSIGLSAGTAHNSDAGWLKWVKDHKIMFVAKKTFRYNLSWDAIDARGAVTGTRTIAIGGKTYKVRLLTGGNGDPASEAGGEWNMIMYGAFQTLFPFWDFFSDTDLLTHSSAGNGSWSWCQEVSAANAAHRVRRGNSGVAGFDAITSSGTGADTGWRPVLELL